ncbi:stage III sporulation protein AF [Tissierella praeacuta]|uniref:stage III sporulation protein AF n=1 Tax=Tissierella praeacuta TaxID=43131 RepID=UPI0033428638
MSFISTWLKDIVILFILISIAELIMPKGNMKKYINMVIGLLIIFTIISPFVKLVKLNFNFEQAVFNYSKPDSIKDIQDNEFYIQQEEQIKKVYKEKIVSEIRGIVEEKTDYKVVNITVGIIEEEKDYGDIDYLDIIICEDDNITNDNKISIEKVKSIDIRNNINTGELLDGDYDDIKELISTKYTVDKNRINIKIYKKGKGE